MCCLNFTKKLLLRIVITSKRAKDIVKGTRKRMATCVSRSDYRTQMHIKFVNFEELIQKLCVLCQGANLCFSSGLTQFYLQRNFFNLPPNRSCRTLLKQIICPRIQHSNPRINIIVFIIKHKTIPVTCLKNNNFLIFIFSDLRL